MKESVDVAHSKEALNYYGQVVVNYLMLFKQMKIGADIITCPTDVVKKVNTNLGRDINELSVDTVKGFAKDIQSSGLSIL